MSVPRSPSSPQVHSATVLLKVRIGDAEIKGVKEVQGKKNPPNYFCSVHVLDRNYNPVGTPELTYQSGQVTSIAKGWNQNCALNLFAPWPQFYSSLRVFVSAVKEGKEAKILATTHIQLDDVPTTGKLEKRFPFLDSKEKENGSIFLTLNWFGNKSLVTGPNPEKKRPDSMFVNKESLSPIPETRAMGISRQPTNQQPTTNSNPATNGAPQSPPVIKTPTTIPLNLNATANQAAKRDSSPRVTGALTTSTGNLSHAGQNSAAHANQHHHANHNHVAEPNYDDLLKSDASATGGATHDVPSRTRKTTLMEDPIQARQQAIGMVYKSTEQEAIKLEQRVAALKERVEAERIKKQKLQAMLMRYRDVDQDIADLVGGSIDWSVIREKEQPELKPVGQESFYLCENDTAKNWAKFITSQSELNHIARVSTKLAQADPIWLKEFLDADGLLYIYSLLHTVESFSLNKTKTIDSEKETELAKLIILIMNTQSAAEYVIRENELVMKNIIVLVLGSNNNTMKIMMFYFIAAVAIYGKNGNKLVKSAFGHFGDIDEEGRNSKYEILFQTIAFSPDPDLVTSALAVLNGILVGEKNLSDRMSSRNLFTLKLAKTFEKLRSAFFFESALIKQLDVFDYMAEQDNKELKEMRFTGMNLSDPHMLLRCIISQTNSLDVSDIFLRHLQQLMLIPQCKTNPITLWRYIEKSSRAVTSAGGHKIINQKEENFHVYLYKVLQGEKVREMMIDEAFSAQEQEDEQIERELQELKQMNNPQGLNTLKSPRSQSFGTFGSNDRVQEPLGQQMKSPRSLSFVQYGSNGEPVKATTPRINKEKTLNTRASTGQASLPNPNPNMPMLGRTNSAHTVLQQNRDRSSATPSSTAHLHAQRQQVVLTEQLTVAPIPQSEQEALAQQNALGFKKPKGPIKRGGPVPKLVGVPTGSNPQTLVTGSPRQSAGGVSPKAASTEETDLNKMFEGLQNDFMPIDALYTNKFVAPSKGSKQKKIQMLPGRVSGNIAIFRRQYKFTDYEFMKYMFDVESDISSSINYEALLSIIPSPEQMESLLHYTGHVEDLDAPEQFVLQLWQVPHCKEKIESIVFWKEYGGQITIIENAISLVINACDQIFNSQKLKNILGIILSIGNFLNIGTPRGNAQAIDVKSLSKLNDMRATTEAGKGNYNLLLYLVDFCYDKPKFKQSLFFIEDLTLLPEIQKSNKEDILSELNTIEQGVMKVKALLDMTKTDGDSSFDDDNFSFYDLMTNFFDMATNEVSNLKDRHEHFQSQIAKLVEIFASAKTPMVDIFKELMEFGTLLKRAALETEERRQIQNDTVLSEAWMVIDGEAYDEDGNPIPMNNKKESSVGIIDRLMKSIERGEFGI